MWSPTDRASTTTERQETLVVAQGEANSGPSWSHTTHWTSDLWAVAATCMQPKLNCSCDIATSACSNMSSLGDRSRNIETQANEGPRRAPVPRKADKIATIQHVHCE